VKRYVVVAVLVVTSVAVVDELGDLFQTRADHVDPDSRSEVVLDVDERRYKHSLDEGAEALVVACAGSVANRVLDDPGVVEIGPGRYRFLVQPSLGRHNRVKLVGCLEDGTIDHLRGDVVSVEPVDIEGTTAPRSPREHHPRR
jgi:hypothetical protein